MLQDFSSYVVNKMFWGFDETKVKIFPGLFGRFEIVLN